MLPLESGELDRAPAVWVQPCFGRFELHSVIDKAVEMNCAVPVQLRYYEILQAVPAYSVIEPLPEIPNVRLVVVPVAPLRGERPSHEVPKIKVAQSKVEDTTFCATLRPLRVRRCRCCVGFVEGVGHTGAHFFELIRCDISGSNSAAVNGLAALPRFGLVGIETRSLGNHALHEVQLAGFVGIVFIPRIVKDFLAPKCEDFSLFFEEWIVRLSHF